VGWHREGWQDERMGENSEQSREIPPHGARIRRADGSAAECDLRRGRTSAFYGGYTVWEAVARDAIRLDYDSDRFECDTVPPGTVICFVVPLLPGSDGTRKGDWAGERIAGVTLTSDFPCPDGGTGLTWPTRPGPLPEGDGPFSCEYPAAKPYPLANAGRTAG
jgi:hypothetical protein